VLHYRRETRTRRLWRRRVEQSET